MVTKWRVDGDKMRTTQEEMATNSSDFSSLPPVYVVLSKKNVVSFLIVVAMSQNFKFKGFPHICCGRAKSASILFLIFVVVTTKNGLTSSFFLFLLS